MSNFVSFTNSVTQTLTNLNLEMEGGPGSIILEMEKKLESKRFNQRGKKDQKCKISVNYYWDLLKYVDDDYLTEWEVLKFKDLYVKMLTNMVCQTTVVGALSSLAAMTITAPFYKINNGGYALRLPVTAI